MTHRRLLTLAFTAFALMLAGCASNPSLVSIQITPNKQLFGGPGLTAQLTAIGTYDQGNHPPSTRDITDMVTWKSNAVSVATVSAAGVATSGPDIGSTDVTASMNGFGGLIIGHATVIVCQIDPSNPSQCKSGP